jgi:hypothetical protein
LETVVLIKESLVLCHDNKSRWPLPGVFLFISFSSSFFLSFLFQEVIIMKLVCLLIVSLSLLVACGMGKKVHVVYMNHLDVGFNGQDKIGFTYNVVNLYFDKYFPLAVKVSEDIRKLPGNERFVYTTHSWLVSLYLHCPTNGIFHCPTEDQRQSFIQTIQKGDVVWYAHDCVVLSTTSITSFLTHLTCFIFLLQACLSLQRRS